MEATSEQRAPLLGELRESVGVFARARSRRRETTRLVLGLRHPQSLGDPPAMGRRKRGWKTDGPKVRTPRQLWPRA